MAIPIEGYTVVAQRERIQTLLDSDEFPPVNTTVLCDEHLWRCCFMAHADALELAQALEKLGLNISVGPDSDVVVVNEFDRSVDPYCEWLNIGEWEKAVIAWLTGTEVRTVTAREGWDPKVGSGLTFSDGTDGMELLRLEGNVAVYRDNSTGTERFIGHTSRPLDVLFELSSKAICARLRTAGEPPVTGADVEAVSGALAMLDEVRAKVTDNWRVFWLYGMGQMALGDIAAAHESLELAWNLEKNEVAIQRELAGACLSLGKFDQAVALAERAVAARPDDSDLLSNLALAYVLAGRTSAAQKTIQAALDREPNDQITRHLQRAIDDVAAKRRPQPKTLLELQRPWIPPRKFWQFWKW